MTNGFITIYTAFVYYCCLVAVAKNIVCNKPRKGIIILPFLFYLLLFVISYTDDPAVLSQKAIGLLFAQFLFLKVSFYKLNIWRLVLVYIYIYCFYLIVSSVISALIPHNQMYVDFAATSVYAFACILICGTKVKNGVRQILEWTPKYVLVISAILLFVATITSVLISGFQQFAFPEVWNKFVQVFVSFLLFVICAVVPVIFMIAISNTRLKSLTADYEQQIRAQAAHYKELARANYETRRFRHDFHNMRIALEELYAQGQYEKAMELLRRHGRELDEHRGRFETGNGIADALLTDKQTKASAHNSDLIFEGVIPSDSPEPTDLCVILGNTLDNAIEACGKLPEDEDKRIHINSICCNGFWFLTVRNPIAGPVAIEGGGIATTKENKTLHGFGLYSLKTVVRKYDGTVELSAEGQVFTARIELMLK